jgi:biotin operon repressor
MTDQLTTIIKNYTHEFPISGKDLALRLKVNERTLRDLVHEARKQGVPIGSLPSVGYFMIRSQEEAYMCLNTMKKHSLSQLENLSVFKRMIKTAGLQQSLNV